MTAPERSAETAAPPKKSSGPADRSRRGKERREDAGCGEIGGPEGPEPTRYGDWEVGGRCTDF